MATFDEVAPTLDSAELKGSKRIPQELSLGYRSLYSTVLGCEVLESSNTAEKRTFEGTLVNIRVKVVMQSHGFFNN